MTATRYIPRDGRRRPGSHQFRSRVEGHARAKHVWICQPCNRWYDQAPAKSRGTRRCTECGGEVTHFDSEVEARRWQVLRIRLAAGDISDLQHHPRIDLVAPGPGGLLVTIGRYEADPRYIEAGEQVWEDVKPKNIRAIDPLADWKMRHFEAQTGIAVRIVN